MSNRYAPFIHPITIFVKMIVNEKITVFLPALCFAIFICFQATAQKLPARWDEITASDWNNALTQSNKTCILPIGILENMVHMCP